MLGAIGLSCAGPFAATLLVGRTGTVPSLRWLGACLATWVVLGALGWAPARGSLVRAAAALWPTAALAAFLPWAYADDQAFHALTRAASRAIFALAGLTALGIGTSVGSDRRARARPWRADSSSPILVAVVAGMCLMFGLNDVLFEPLGVSPRGPLAALHVLMVALPAAVLALAIRARLLAPLEGGVLTALAGGAGFLAVWLGVAPPAPALFAIALAGLVTVTHEEYWLTLGQRVRGPAIGAIVVGVALASTDPVKFGLGARELIAAAPEPARLLPAVGLLAIATALALGAGAQTPRSAAIGGTRDA